MTAPSPLARKRITLPRTSTRSQKLYAHVKVIERVKDASSTMAFEGRIFPPGATVTMEDLGAQAVALECVGPVGNGPSARQREILWILWRYCWDFEMWKEIARAQSYDASWALVLKEPAKRALYPEPEMRDVIAYWRKVVETIMETVDQKIELEEPDIKLVILSAVYDQVAGRIASQMGY